MRRFTDMVVWIPAIALLALFIAGVLYSLLVPEGRITLESSAWIGK